MQNLDLGSYNSTVKRYLGFFMSSLRGLMCDEGGANIMPVHNTLIAVWDAYHP